MLPDPIHPFVVHFPIVLSVALPISALWALWTIAGGAPHRKAWLLPFIMAALLTASSYLALKTGEAQEDRVEAVVGEPPLHTHEEAAELFLFLSGATVILLTAGLLGGTPGRGIRILGTLTTAVLLVAGARVGASGGKLVYEHGAAQAYQAGAPNTPGGSARSQAYVRKLPGPGAASADGEWRAGDGDTSPNTEGHKEGRS